MAPGASHEITIAIMNNSDQTNSADCKITLAGKQSCKNVPLTQFTAACMNEVAGRSAASFTFPISMGANIEADGTVYEVNLTFRDANGKTFGTPIPIKVRCGQAQGAAMPAPAQVAAPNQPRWNL